MKKITLTRIIDRLNSRFRLVESTPQEFLLNEQLQPITNFDDLLKISHMHQYTISITATNAYTVFTVPAGKRWTLINAIAEVSTGVYTFNAFQATDISDSATLVVIEVQAVATTIKLTTPRSPIIFEAGDVLSLNVGGYTSTGNALVSVVYLEEDAY